MSSTSAFSLLVIDDEPDLRTLYELTLLREGYELDTAGSVAEALDRLQQRKYSAVITDMRLPDGSGLDVLAWLEAQGRPEKALVITAFGSAENAVEALEGGRLRLPDQAGGPAPVPHGRGLGAWGRAGRRPARRPPGWPAPRCRLRKGSPRCRWPTRKSFRWNRLRRQRRPSRCAAWPCWRAWPVTRPSCRRCAA